MISNARGEGTALAMSKNLLRLSPRFRMARRRAAASLSARHHRNSGPAHSLCALIEAMMASSELDRSGFPARSRNFGFGRSREIGNALERLTATADAEE